MTGRSNEAFYEQPAVVSRYVAARGDGLTDREAAAVERYFTPGSRVLDLGCGAGRTTRALADRGFDETGVDLSQPMVWAATAADPDLTYVVADASRLPFAAESFDHVLFSYNGLDELRPATQRSNALSEINRVLAFGGRFAFSTHNILRKLVPAPVTRPHLTDLWRFWRTNARLRQFGPYKRPAEDEPPTYFTDPVSVRRQLDTAGFDLLALLGRDSRLSKYFGAALFPVAEKTRT